jgi:NAD(P)-dependent dehydrogenase (short-subunit alcohol dehydrogenase family)
VVLLKDKITLITGAGRGLGQAVALAFAQHGAQVIATARTESELNRTAELVRESLKLRRQGSIINVSSRAGVEGFPLETAYCASKFGLEGFSRALAMELREYNIAVNTITPGGVSYGVRIKPTSVTQAQYDALDEREKASWQDPMLLTEAFVYLAFQDAGGVTGERIHAYPLSERIRQEGWDIQV